MRVTESAVDIVRRWEEHGATWRAVHVSDQWVVLDLCECTGAPVERLESGDPELIRFVREQAA
jgi:hypothetical protein